MVWCITPTGELKKLLDRDARVGTAKRILPEAARRSTERRAGARRRQHDSALSSRTQVFSSTSDGRLAHSLWMGAEQGDEMRGRVLSVAPLIATGF
jgi:hypothetical protein